MPATIDPAFGPFPKLAPLARLREASPFLFALVAGTAGFAAYFAMYAFRKPIAAATFDIPGWGFAIDYKTCLIIAQVIGYALSKFLGIKVISEFGRRGRAYAIIGLVVAAWGALVLFALVPAPWNIALLFLNGVPLGMIWGLVFSYMEGRRSTEMLGAMMCASFIIASGVVKSVGTAVMTLGTDAFWMPAVTGALFFPLLLVSVLVLEWLPPPDATDEKLRSPRVPMDSAARRAVLARHGGVLLVVVAIFTVAGALRDFRDSFAAEIWTGLGYGKDPAVFSQSELPVAAIVLIMLASLATIRDNRRALYAMYGLVVAGGGMLAGATWAFQAGMISPLAWVIATGTGLYLAYTPFNAMAFDRLVAVFGSPGNAGFMIYLADAVAYGGSVGLLLFRSFAAPKLDWVIFFTWACYAAAAVIIPLALLAASMVASDRNEELSNG